MRRDVIYKSVQTGKCPTYLIPLYNSQPPDSHVLVYGIICQHQPIYFRVKTKFGERTFLPASPLEWNAQPNHIRDVPNS